MTESRLPKVVELGELAQRVAEQRAAGRTVVHCHGVFDLLHVGHLRYLKGARSHGDVLVVTVTPDRFVDKGTFRPAFSEELRLEALAALEVVDWVALNDWPTAEQTLRTVRADLYAKGAEFRRVGSDPTGKMELERAVAGEVGCGVVFVDDLVFSSSELINRHLDSYPEEVARHLGDLRQTLGPKTVELQMQRFAGVRVAVIGATVEETTVLVERLGFDREGSPRVRQSSKTRCLIGAAELARSFALLGAETRLVTCGPPEDLRELLPEVTVTVPSGASNWCRRRRWREATSGRTWLLEEPEEERPLDSWDWVVESLAEAVDHCDLVVFWETQPGGDLDAVVRGAAESQAVLCAIGGEGMLSRLPGECSLGIQLTGKAGDLPEAQQRTLGLLANDGRGFVVKEGHCCEAPDFAPERESGDRGRMAFAAALSLAETIQAPPEFSLLAAQAARQLEVRPAGLDHRLLQRQLTSMMK